MSERPPSSGKRHGRALHEEGRRRQATSTPPTRAALALIPAHVAVAALLDMAFSGDTEEAATLPASLEDDDIHSHLSSLPHRRRGGDAGE